MTATTYLSAAETAKLVRAALKRAFPGVKFSVRSPSAIHVRWTDGPTRKAVEAVAGQFQGGAFDGSIDLKISMSHWLLPDGSTTIASNPGTVGSMGSIPAEREWMPHPEAKLVRFCADFIFCDRDLSADLKARIEAFAARRLPQDMDAWSRERVMHRISSAAMVQGGALYVARDGYA